MSRIVLILLSILFGLSLPAAADENDGQAVYKARCQVCHGEGGTPKKFASSSPAFSDEAWKRTTSVEAIEKVVGEGRNRMPSFKNKLTPEQIKAVSAYIKTL